MNWITKILKVGEKIKSSFKQRATKAEQMATASYLSNFEATSTYLTNIKEELNDRLISFYDHFTKLQSKGYPVKAIEPEAALYLTVQFDLIGK